MMSVLCSMARYSPPEAEDATLVHKPEGEEIFVSANWIRAVVVVVVVDVELEAASVEDGVVTASGVGEGVATCDELEEDTEAS